ncbi:MAG: 4Fe-4S binding protein [Puniceicoccales bacterium]|jgi:[FeFe] hydrogenase (group B1/B3)|nr:4Fe-4S binding protein [Puniceicoccales bacterium]
MNVCHYRRKREILPPIIDAFRYADFSRRLQKMLDDGLPESIQCAKAIRRGLIFSALGMAMEEDDGKTSIEDAVERCMRRERKTLPPLTMMRCACHRCRGNCVRVTDLCQNCVAKPCISSCRFGAIAAADGRSFIDESLCKKCGQCARFCPYGAIVRTVCPCENACPVDAISKDKFGFASIDHDRCIHCGKCLAACPFEAIQVRSQIIDVLRQMREGRQVIALLSPAALGQFPCSGEQLHCALKKIGFAAVYEVAQGAEVTAIHEAQELQERLAAGEKFMTSSCCAAYNILVEKHIPQLKPFVSHTKTPLFYTAERLRKQCGDGVFVFFTPCVAKYGEVFFNENVDYAINLEELNALCAAYDIDFATCDGQKFSHQSAREAREFSLSGGVSRAIQAAWRGETSIPKFVSINGIDRETLQKLRHYGSGGICEDGNMIEVMSCPGGCVGGCVTCRSTTLAQKQIKSYASEGNSISNKIDEPS